MISVDIQAVNSEFINWQALVDKVLVGEKVVILKSGIEVAEISPSIMSSLIEDKETLTEKSLQTNESSKRQLGFMQGEINIPEDINWGDKEILAEFGEI